MLEVERGGERFNFPTWELALEHAAKLLGEVLALTHSRAMRCLRAIKI